MEFKSNFRPTYFSFNVHCIHSVSRCDLLFGVGLHMGCSFLHSFDSFCTSF